MRLVRLLIVPLLVGLAWGDVEAVRLIPIQNHGGAVVGAFVALALFNGLFGAIAAIIWKAGEP